MSHYAGMYYKDDILHIKVIVNQQNIIEAIKDICYFTSTESIAFRKQFEKNIVIKYDGIYEIKYLKKAMNHFPEEQLFALSIYGIGIKPSINGFSVSSDVWTESKKQQTAELLEIDINHIDFEISSGTCIDN